jgi:hypothetical protein
MLELLEKDLPWFTVRQRIRRYFRHFEDDWDSTQGSYPTLLLVCEDTILQRQVQRWAARLFDRNDSEFKVYTTTTKAMMDSSKRKDNIWSDVVEPDDLASLDKV